MKMRSKRVHRCVWVKRIQEVEEEGREDREGVREVEKEGREGWEASSRLQYFLGSLGSWKLTEKRRGESE